LTECYAIFGLERSMTQFSALKQTGTSSVAPSALPRCPQLSAIVRRETGSCTAAATLWARPRTAQQQARAAARAPAVPLESEPLDHRETLRCGLPQRDDLDLDLPNARRSAATR